MTVSIESTITVSTISISWLQVQAHSRQLSARYASSQTSSLRNHEDWKYFLRMRRGLDRCFEMKEQCDSEKVPQFYGHQIVLSTLYGYHARILRLRVFQRQYRILFEILIAGV